MLRSDHLGLLLGMGALASLMLWVWLSRKRLPRRYRLFATLPMLTAGLISWILTHPGDAFYQKEFRAVTGSSFPEGGEIVLKTASVPDAFGDYGACFMARFEPDFLEELEKSLPASGYLREADHMSAPEPDDVLRWAGYPIFRAEYVRKRGTEHASVRFLHDEGAVILTSLRW